MNWRVNSRRCLVKVNSTWFFFFFFFFSLFIIVGLTSVIVVWKIFSVFSFPKTKSNFHYVKTKNQNQVFGVFWKLRTKFSGNLVNKPKSCVIHTMCCLLQTQQMTNENPLSSLTHLTLSLVPFLAIDPSHW